MIITLICVIVILVVYIILLRKHVKETIRSNKRFIDQAFPLTARVAMFHEQWRQSDKTFAERFLTSRYIDRAKIHLAKPDTKFVDEETAREYGSLMCKAMNDIKTEQSTCPHKNTSHYSNSSFCFDCNSYIKLPNTTP